MLKSNSKILIITPYPIGVAPSQRFRFEHFMNDLDKRFDEVIVAPFLSKNSWEILYKKGLFISKLRGVIGGYYRRWKLLLSINRYDKILIHREVAPFGFPVFSWLLRKTFKGRIIFDFDDAIWMKNFSHHNRWFSSFKRYKNAIQWMKWSDKLSCGNHWLQEFGGQYNDNTNFIPTIVDTENRHVPNKSDMPNDISIGWTGSHSTIKYLDSILPHLLPLLEETNTSFVVISNQPPSTKHSLIDFVPWNEESEINALKQFQIGVMPLPDEDWAKGKCGFKIIQYMSMGIVPVASPVGTNHQIIIENVNGVFANELEDWKKHLRELLSNSELRTKLAGNCRSRIEEHYSVNSNRDKFLNLFEFE